MCPNEHLQKGTEVALTPGIITVFSRTNFSRLYLVNTGNRILKGNRKINVKPRRRRKN